MPKDRSNSKIMYTGLGLVFGTALGTGLCIILDQPVYWAGAGTAVGLIIGAVLDAYHQKSS